MMDIDFWDKFELREKAIGIGGAVVATASHRAIGARLSLALDSFRTRPNGMVGLIYGESQIGKTLACEAFLESYAESVGGEYKSYSPTITEGDEQDDLASASYVSVPGGRSDHKPVVMIQVGAAPTFKGLLKDTIHAVTKEPAPRTATGPALVNLLAKHLRGQQTHLIIFDDGHYLTHAMNRPDQNSAQGLLASICKTTKTEVMVVGQNLAKNLIVSDVLKDLKEQVYEVMSLPPPPRPEDCEDDAEEPPFMSFLRKLVAELDFGGPTDLLEWRVAIRIHSYARGRPGLVSALLQLGAKYAVAHKAGMVDMNILYLTLRDAMGVAHEDNVFRTTGNEPALVEYPGVFSLEPRYNV